MRAVIRPAVAAALALPLLFGCSKQERSLWVRGDIEVERQFGLTGALSIDGRLRSTDLPQADFDAAWNIVTRGQQSAGGIAVTLAAASPQNASLIALHLGVILVIPTPLQAGASYPIGETLLIGQDALPLQWSFWGPRMLSVAGEAAFGMRVFDYHGIGQAIVNNFNATDATGTVEVVRRRGEQVDLRLDVTATDQSGREVRVHGEFSIAPENYTPPIT